MADMEGAGFTCAHVRISMSIRQRLQGITGQELEKAQAELG
jgi:hypothetical protein